MQEKLQAILHKAVEALASSETSQAINDLKVKFLGKSGEVTALLKSLKDYSAEERPLAGKLINELRQKIEEFISNREKFIIEKEKFARFEVEALDVTLSKPSREYGALHPISIVINDIIDTFIGLGFEVKDGPEIELDYYNFTALNTPEDHPARDMQDTFYITDRFLLRSQTSAVQVHTMEQQKPPIRIVCPGKVYRSDDDASHSPMFHQIEGLVVDEHITLCDLQGMLDTFAKSFFSPTTKVRLRPSYFPFTEPSVEVDLSCSMCGGAGCRLCKGTGWLEVLGAGIVNPAVLELSGIDSQKYTGLAFGLGVERAAMIKYGIPNMKFLFENDIRLLKQYK